MLRVALRSRKNPVFYVPTVFWSSKKTADDSRKIQREGCAPRPRFLCPMPQSHLIYRNWHVAPRTVSRAIVIRNKELLPRDPFRSHPLSDESSSENFDRGFVRSTGKERANIERCFRLNSELNVREAFCCGHTHGCFRGCGFSSIDRRSFNIFDACYQISFDLLAIQVRFIKYKRSTVKEYLYPDLRTNALIFIGQYISFSQSLIEQCHNIKF